MASEPEAVIQMIKGIKKTVKGIKSGVKVKDKMGGDDQTCELNYKKFVLGFYVASCLAIVAYTGIVLMLLNGGYQDHAVPITSIMTKAEALSYINSTELDIKPVTGVTDRLWDTSDIVSQAETHDAIFFKTNMVMTSGQQLGECPESQEIASAWCANDCDCPAGNPVTRGHGVRTGICNTTTGTCMIHAWCPVETVDIPYVKNGSVFQNAENFTVLILNTVSFVKFGLTKSNIQEGANETYLLSCYYDKDHPVYKNCPMFRLSTIVREAGGNFDKVAYEPTFLGSVLLSLSPKSIKKLCFSCGCCCCAGEKKSKKKKDDDTKDQSDTEETPLVENKEA